MKNKFFVIVLSVVMGFAAAQAGKQYMGQTCNNGSKEAVKTAVERQKQMKKRKYCNEDSFAAVSKDCLGMNERQQTGKKVKDAKM